MPASRAVRTSVRTSSSVLSWMRMSPSTTFGTSMSVPGRVKVFTGSSSGWAPDARAGAGAAGAAPAGSGGRQARDLVGGEDEVGGAGGVPDALGARGAGDGDDDGRERELPRE